MINEKITKDADKLICLIYQGYLEDRESGKSKIQAKQLGSSDDVFNRFLIDTAEDVAETCRELSRADFLHCTYADNIVYTATLTDDAIVYMENRFKNGLSEVMNFLLKLK